MKSNQRCAKRSRLKAACAPLSGLPEEPCVDTNQRVKLLVAKRHTADKGPTTSDEKERVSCMIDEGWNSARAGQLISPEQLEKDMAEFKRRWKRDRGIA